MHEQPTADFLSKIVDSDIVLAFCTMFFLDLSP